MRLVLHTITIVDASRKKTKQDCVRVAIDNARCSASVQITGRHMLA